MAVDRLSSIVKHCLPLWLLITILSGCMAEAGTTVTSCELFNDPLRSISLDEQFPATAPVWVTSTYNIPEAQVRHVKFAGEEKHSAVAWDENHNGHGIYFSDDEAINSHVRWERSQPTLQQVLNCLGEPEHYAIYFNDGPHGNWLFELELWYPGEGLMVEYAEPVRGDRAPTVNADFPMEQMTITRPGDLESVVRAAYVPRGEWVIQDALHTVRPWPDQLTDLHVTQGTRQ